MPHHHSVGLSALPVGMSAYGRSQMSGDQRHPHHQSLSRCPEVGHAMSLKILRRDFVKSPCQEQITDLTNLLVRLNFHRLEGKGLQLETRFFIEKNI